MVVCIINRFVPWEGVSHSLAITSQMKKGTVCPFTAASLSNLKENCKVYHR